MNKVIILLSVFLLGACTQTDLSTDFKSKNGIHICEITAVKGEQVSCDQILEFSNDLAFNWGIFPNNQSNSIFTGAVLLIGTPLECRSSVDFFPISLVEMRSKSNTEKVIIGIPASSKNNPEELTTFFDFQMKHSYEMKSISNWIEDEFKDDWILVSWENENEARSYLERSIKNF